MEPVNDQTLDQIAQSNDERPGAVDTDDRIDDPIIISLFVEHLFLFIDQLFNDISKIRRQRLAYLRSGIFGSHPLAHLDQTVEGDLIPVLQIRFGLFDQIQLLLRIIYERGQLLFIADTEGIAKFVINLGPHCSGPVFQHMKKLIRFPMDITDHMFRTFWQVQYGLQVDDLR